MPPVAAARGSSRTTYVPVALRSSVTVFPVGLTMTAASVVPFGRRIVTCDDEIETADRTSETRRPAVGLLGQGPYRRPKRCVVRRR